MKAKHITYDIPIRLDVLLSAHAQYLGIDKGGLVLDCIARKVQADLSNLALTSHQYIEPLKAIHAWRTSEGVLRKSGIQTPSNIEAMLVAIIENRPPLSIPTTYRLPTITPCKRTRNYTRMPHELLRLLNTLPYTPLNNFITVAIFNGLENNLITLSEERIMTTNQEYIPAQSTYEQRQLLAELRDLRLRLTNLESQIYPSHASGELMVEVFLQLVREETTKRLSAEGK